MPDPRVLPTAYLNGEFLPVEEARVPALDRGFLFGDAIYEVVPVYAGHLFRITSHVERLLQGLSKINIHCSHTASDWTNIFQRTVDANGGGDQYVYLQVTRGVSHYRDHATPSDIEPLVFAMSQKLTARSDSVSQRGVDAVLLPDTRWTRCDIKSTSLLANVMLRQQAVEQDCTEAILHRDGFVTEGAASTIMLVLNDTLLVPPDTHAVLPGTTRRLAVELADAIGLPWEARRFTVAELYMAEEVLLSAATKEVLPVCRIEQKAVGTGTPGSRWRQLDDAYQAYKARVIAA